jgi:hypothetical protein
MEIDYRTFKDDCLRIIQPIIEKYSYSLDNQKSGDYTNYYIGGNGYIVVSMLENFPHIGVSLWYYPLNLKFIKPSLLDEKLGISQNDKFEFYKLFESNNDLSDYSNQMKYVIENMEKFYKPIVTGEVKLEEISQ